MSKIPHLLFLMSDTGGGHRAAARAIEAALTAKHPHQFTTELVDLWKDYTPYPFSTMPQTYTRWVNTHPWSYEAQFWLNDRLLRFKPYSQLISALMYADMQRMYQEHPADVVICVHSVFVRPAVNVLRRERLPMPFLTVITDYALPTVAWYDARVDLCMVPVPPAYDRGLQCGLSPDQMVLTGAPIHPRFTEVALNKAEARQQLGWPANERLILMVGGGDGMGPLVETAHAIDQSIGSGALRGQLIIIAGRNDALRSQLEQRAWQHPVHIYGFVDNMPTMMRAADILVTKAGPATITEAAAMGLPMILSGAIRHQESPNVDYVVAQEAGLDAAGPERVANALQRVLNDDAALAHLSAGAQHIAQPDAAWKIADHIWRYCPSQP